ncbi:ATP-dependent helicase [Zhongshania sp.]|uniref:ATP-dependent helicase n=1 Tax=Zhongshania sp. TaxID=1971902 RepID=UPI002A8283BB|nr:ATP-dependent helicase [Zhongshania sp.]
MKRSAKLAILQDLFLCLAFSMLTEEQQIITRHRGGHARVMAVAGAGKTSTMVAYVLARLREGMDPRLIRVVMFNKAAQEDFSHKLRIAAGANAQLPPVRTFHAMGRNLAMSLAKEGHLAAFDPTPLGDVQAGLEMLKALQAAAGTSALRAAIRDDQQQWLDTFSGFVDLAKSTLAAPEVSFALGGYPEQYQLFIEAFARFEQWRKAAARVSFADFLYDPCRLIANDPALANFLANRVELFVVDEFQDINDIQFFMLKTLAGERAQLQVVGDADQCIYEFRGAKPEYMLSYFGDTYSHQSYQLSRTFRYGHQLALAAAQLISHNQRRDPLLCISADSAAPSHVELCLQNPDGAVFAQACEAQRAEGRAYSEMAFLCRTWAQAAPVELALLKRGIPNRVMGGSRVLERSEIKVLMSLLRLMAGEFASQDSAEQHQQLFDILKFCELKIRHEVLRGYAERIVLSDFSALHRSEDSLSFYQEKRLQSLATVLAQLGQERGAGRGLRRFVNDLDLLNLMRDNALNREDGENRAATVSAFIEFVALQQDQAPSAILAMLAELSDQSGCGDTTAGAVTITTMHRSKGLEWPVVLLPNLSAHYMPYQAGNRRRQELDHLEAERRLMYVAMTRAIKALYLFAPGLDATNGWSTDQRPELHQLPSPFLAEMNLDLAQRLSSQIEAGARQFDLPPSGGATASVAQRYLDAVVPEWQANTAVSSVGYPELGAYLQHTRYGLGRVSDIDALGLVVSFSSTKRFFPRLLVSRVLQPAPESAVSAALAGAGASAKDFCVGDILAHDKFGRGAVLAVDKHTIAVNFSVGRKTFRLDLFQAKKIA